MRGARSLQGNWSSGGSTSRRSQEAAMAVVPGEEGEVVGKGSTRRWTAGAVSPLLSWCGNIRISMEFYVLAKWFDNSNLYMRWTYFLIHFCCHPDFSVLLFQCYISRIPFWNQESYSLLLLC